MKNVRVINAYIISFIRQTLNFHFQAISRNKWRIKVAKVKN